MSGSIFYNAGSIEQVAINLFYGWGYNFYRTENQLRSDDLLIRSKVSWLLGSARASVEAAESAYRRAFLPSPSRDAPRPNADAVAGAQSIERLSHDIGTLEGQIRAQPVPENDRMIQLHRQESVTLARLLDHDHRLVGQSELLRAMLDQKDGGWIIENSTSIKEGLTAIAETLRDRQSLLLI